MFGKHFGRRAVAAALAVAILCAVSFEPVPASASSLSDLQQTQSDLKKKGQDLDSQLAKLKNDKAKQQQYKTTLDNRVVNLEQQIDAKNSEIQQLDAKIIKSESEISNKQKEIDADFQKLRQRVYALYLTGEASNLEIILNAKSIMDLSDKAEILKVISEHDTNLMDTLKKDIQSIQAQKTEIENDRKAASSARTSLEENQKQLQALSDESAKVIASLNNNQQQIEEEQKKCRIDQKTAQTAVDNWLANYYAEQAAKKKKEEKAAASKPNSPAKQSDNSSPSSGSSHPSSGGQASGNNGPLPADRVKTMQEVAEQYKGFPYVWGGRNPKTSFDCSGYVSWVINHSGWNVGRRGVDGLYAICTPISSANACPGDLIFYNYTYAGEDGNLLPRSHVGIYFGGGLAIQCDTPGVEYVNINSSYWHNHFDCFGRLPH